MAAGVIAGTAGALAMSPLMSRRATRRRPRRFHLREFPPRLAVAATGEYATPGGCLPRSIEGALTGPAKIPFPFAAHLVFGITTAALHEALTARLTRTRYRRCR